jgi:hypothetical protein
MLSYLYVFNKFYVGGMKLGDSVKNSVCVRNR